MLKRLLSLVVVIAAILTVGLSPSGNNALLNRHKKECEQPICALEWPSELALEGLPAIPGGIDFCDETEEAIVIKRRVYSYENYLKYLNSFAISDLGIVTFYEHKTPVECIYYTVCNGLQTSVKYYSDLTMPEFNIVIVIEKPLNI